jgi:amino acid adenylation domain-containing protein
MDGQETSVREAIGDVIARHAARAPEAAALLGRACRPLTYAALDGRVQQIREHLNAHGIGRGDRVAVVVRDWPVALVSYLAVVSSAVAVPMNPAATLFETEAVLRQLKVAAVLVSDDLPEVARLARRIGAAVFVAAGRGGGPAGDFALTGGIPGGAARPGPAEAGDIACIQATSGTTGQAKAVRQRHEALLFRAERDRRILRLTPEDVTINFRPPYLAGPLNIGLLATVASGGAVVARAGFDADEIVADLIDFGITWFTGGPAHHRAILEAVPRHGDRLRAGCLRFVRSAGYPLALDLEAAIEATFGVPCIQKYGSSEAGLVSCNPLPPGVRKAGSCGYPVDCEVAIRDGDGAALPPGETGEIWVRGPGVFDGYEDPELTRAAFADGWFRTGDLGRIDPDGYLWITGRASEIINRGGQKIAPQEVEAAFRGLPGVAEALCFPIPHPTLGATAGLAIVPAGADAAPDPEALKRMAAERLARFKIPERIVLTDAIPLGPTGKPIRREAAAAFGLTTAAEGEGRAPADRLEQIWAATLGTSRIDDTADFTAAGGDSLRALRLHFRIEEEFGVALPDDTLYGPGTTLAGLRACIAAAHAAGAVPARSLPWRAPARGAELPLTSSQLRVWSICRTFPDVANYNSAFGLRFPAPFDAAAMQAAVDLVVRRHEALRATFPDRRGVPAQVFLANLDVRLHVARVEAALLADIGNRLARRPHDLAHGPLVRADALVTEGGSAVLLFQTHHIVGDATSTGILSRELTAAYTAYREGREPELPAVHVPFGDFVADQAARLDPARREALLDFWMNELEGAAPVIDLPDAKPRPELMSYRGERLRVALPPALAQALRAVATKLGSTPFAVARAAFDVLVHRLTGLTDFAIGTAIDTRPPGAAGPIVGFCLSTVPVRARLRSGMAFAELVRETQAALSRARAHAEVPVEEIVRRKAPSRRGAVNPLFQSVFGFMPRGTRPSDLGNAEAQLWNLDHDRARFDLTLMLEETEAGLGGFLECATDLYDRAAMLRLFDRYAWLLGEALADPGREIDDYQVAPPAEMGLIRTLGHGRETPYPAQDSIPSAFASVVGRNVTGTAVERGTRRLTYGALDAWSNAVASALAARGVAPEEVVAISGERTPEAIASLLGILKAGGAYLVLDPALPLQRVTHMLRDAGARLVLVQEGSQLALPEGVEAMPVPAPAAASGPVTCPAGPRSLAYLCYTSGSTGEPKAVEIEHRSALRLVLGADYCDLASGERILQTGSLGFDASTFEIWGALLNGGTLVQPESERPTLHDYERAIERHGVTTAWFTAGLFRHLVDAHPGALARVRQVLVGGDTVSPDHALRLLDAAPDCRLINGYGPTENTTFSVCGPLDRATLLEGTAPIGRPIANATAYILDDRLRPVPLGVEGDLHVGGHGVARGYRGRPEATAAAFLPDPFGRDPEARMYRTGDRARFRSDGRIEFLGRRDGQVKIRGFRVETGEIEAVLRQHAAIRDAVVVARREDGAVRSLAAAVIPAGSAVPLPADLHGYLAGRLPDYMIPADFLAVPEFPLNTSGKIDRHAILALCDAGAAEPTPDRALPRTHGEQVLFRLWRELLKRNDFGIDDDFFAVGGDSLLVMQLSFRIREETGLELTNFDVFAHPTIRGIARLIDAPGTGLLPPPARDGVIVPLTRAPEGRNFYIFTGAGGHVLPFASVARRLEDRWRAVGLLDPHFDEAGEFPASIGEVAAQLLEGLLRADPAGPHLLVGYSYGGKVAFEIARRIAEAGGRAGVVMLDTRARPGGTEALRRRIQGVKSRIKAILRPAAELEPIPQTAPDDDPALRDAARRSVMERNQRALVSRYRPRKTAVPIVVIRARGSLREGDPADYRWSKVGHVLGTTDVNGDHLSLFKGPNEDDFVAALDWALSLLRSDMDRDTCQWTPSLGS